MNPFQKNLKFWKIRIFEKGSKKGRKSGKQGQNVILQKTHKKFLEIKFYIILMSLISFDDYFFIVFSGI